MDSGKKRLWLGKEGTSYVKYELRNARKWPGYSIINQEQEAGGLKCKWHGGRCDAVLQEGTDVTRMGNCHYPASQGYRRLAAKDPGTPNACL